MVRLRHPKSGDSEGYETLLTPSADKQTCNHERECSNHHPPAEVNGVENGLEITGRAHCLRTRTRTHSPTHPHPHPHPHTPHTHTRYIYIYIHIYITFTPFSLEMSRNIKSKTKHLKFSYISLFTNMT